VKIDSIAYSVIPLDRPEITGIDNSGGTTVISGTAKANAAITIQDGQGNTWTGTADDDGHFDIDLGSDLSGTPDDLTVVQSVAGFDSDPATITAASLPIVNPWIGGAFLAMSAGLFPVLFRTTDMTFGKRKRASR
jgi:hypothetical protein